MNSKTISADSQAEAQYRPYSNPSEHNERRVYAALLTTGAAAFAAAAGFPAVAAGVEIGGLVGVARSTGQNLKRLAGRTVAGALIGGALSQTLGMAWDTIQPKQATPAPTNIELCAKEGWARDVAGRRVPGIEYVPCDEAEEKSIKSPKQVQIYPPPAASQ